jgi:hypothetical protein
LSSDHEPFGMVLLEAMVAGVPLIATSAGGRRKWSKVWAFCSRWATLNTWLKGWFICRGWMTNSVSQCADMMLVRLRERFSDEAVRNVFWRLPQVTDLTAES